MDKSPPRSKLKPSDNLIGWIAPILLLMFAAGPAILGLQALYWLKTGHWPDMQIGIIIAAAGLEPETINWVGLRRIVVNLCGTPMWLALPALAMGVGMLLVWVGEWFDPKSDKSN